MFSLLIKEQRAALSLPELEDYFAKVQKRCNESGNEGSALVNLMETSREIKARKLQLAKESQEAAQSGLAADVSALINHLRFAADNAVAEPVKQAATEALSLAKSSTRSRPSWRPLRSKAPPVRSQRRGANVSWSMRLAAIFHTSNFRTRYIKFVCETLSSDVDCLLKGREFVKIVVYFRVSTDKQQRSGLGIEAQQSAVREYALRTGAEVIGKYTETESGKRSDRPQLARALAHAKRSKARLIVAKLDRLARNLAFLDALQKARVDFAALDCEHANKAMLQMMMVMAEWEADQVSARTKAALAARRDRGLPLGAEQPNCRNLDLDDMVAGRLAGAARNAALADDAYQDILPDMAAQRRQGRTLAAIAAELNAAGHTTRQGCTWTPGTVANVLRRSTAA